MIRLLRPTFNAQKWQLPFTVVVLAELVTLMGFQTSISIIPFFLQEDLAITTDREIKFWISILMALPGLTMAIAAPIWGNMADRYGKRIMLLRAMAGGSITIFLMSFVQSPYQLLILRIVQGALTGSVAAATILVASLVPSAKAAFALGVLQVGVYMGGALGPALGGILFKLVGGRANFLTTSLLLFASFLVTFFLVPEPTTPNKTENNAKLLTKKKLIDFSPLIQRPFLLFLISVVFVAQVAFNMVGSIIGVFIQLISPHLSLAQSAKTTGIVLMCAALASAGGAIFFSFLGKRINFEKLLVVSFIGSALCYIPQALSDNWHFLLIFRVIDSFFVGGVIPGLNTMLVANADKQKQGAVFGLSSAFATTGAALGPALGGVIAQLMHGVAGYRLAFFTSSLFLFILSVIIINWLKTSKKSTNAKTTQL
jgi:DHA1 family multidrug resistance protein-like MFS transporter